MQIQRNNAYTSIIVVQPEELKVDKNNPLMAQSLSDNKDPAIGVSLTAYNVGVGAAHSIQFTLDNDPIIDLLKHLKDSDPETEYDWIEAQGSLTIKIGQTEGNINKHLGTSAQFLLPNAGNSMKINFGPMLSMIYSKAAETDGILANIPSLHIKMEYCDVQGQKQIGDIFLDVSVTGVLPDMYMISIKAR